MTALETQRTWARDGYRASLDNLRWSFADAAAREATSEYLDARQIEQLVTGEVPEDGYPFLPEVAERLRPAVAGIDPGRSAELVELWAGVRAGALAAVQAAGDRIKASPVTGPFAFRPFARPGPAGRGWLVDAPEGTITVDGVRSTGQEMLGRIWPEVSARGLPKGTTVQVSARAFLDSDDRCQVPTGVVGDTAYRPHSEGTETLQAEVSPGADGVPVARFTYQVPADGSEPVERSVEIEYAPAARAACTPAPSRGR